MRVLIAGCGYVGCALGERLVRAGHEVWGLRRRPAGLPPGVRGIAADLSRAEGSVELPGELDAVVYAVGADAREEDAYRRAYVDGVARVLSASQPDRFVFVSSTSVYGQSRGEWVDEQSSTEPRSFTGKLVLEGERLALARAPRAVVVRFGGIYGPGRTRLRDSVAAGRARWRPGHFTNRIHLADCAGVLEHLLELPAPEALYLAVDCEPAEERTVMGWLAGRAGVPEPPEAGDAVVGRGAGSKRCSNRRLLESGYGFVHPTFREGYAALG